ncbi:MAG TPA: hypothetical protein VGL94_08120 [Ktedonobacteraceae bacterium]
MPTATPPTVEKVKDDDNAVVIKSHSLSRHFAFFRTLLFSLSKSSKFVFQATGTRTWLQARRNLIPLSIPLTEDGMQTTILEDDDETEPYPDRQMTTWQKVVEPPPNRTPVSYPPRPMISPVVQYVSLADQPELYRRSPKAIFWLCMIVVLVLVGAFGVTGAIGRSSISVPHGPLSLEVTPQEATIGAMVSLRGADFSPKGPVGLTRDASIPILDTAGASITQSDVEGNFTDTVQVQANWGSGSHTINAEDALTHKITSFPIMVSGDDEVALRPSHLQLSIDNLNLGSGDQATNSEQTISLTNLGSGQISWQGSSTESWLMMTPQSGTFYSGTQSKVIIAVDRAGLQPGSYNAHLLFTSNVGNVPLDVNTQVTQLDPQNDAVLQVTPPVLAFTGNDGGFGPAPQVVTVSDPGVQPLNWIASSDVPWLSLSQPGGILQPGNNTQVTASTDTSALLPGTYSGSINISTRGSGTVLHNSQTINVTVTVTPYCDLMFSSGMLSFTADYMQSDPPAKTVGLTSSLSCPAPLSWNVSSNANWLTVGSWSGTTPGSLSVGVHPGGLAPGSYNGGLTFTSSAGTQKLLVSFTLGQPGTPVLSVGSSSLAFGTAIGIQSPPAQTVSLTNSGVRSLLWYANAMTEEGGAWLSVLPASGSLTAYQSTTLSVATNSQGLSVGTYYGTVVITAVDSITGQRIGPLQRVAITLNVGPACTLQAPSTSALQFSALAGSNPAVQTFHVSVAGTCFGSVTVTPTIASSSGWLTVSPASAVIESGQSATFTVGITSASLKAGLYNGSISLSGVSDGVIIAGSSQAVKVTLAKQSGAVLAATPSSLTFNSTTGTSTQPITISNTASSGTLNWKAALQSGAPTFVSLSANSGTNLAGGQNATVNVSVNATGVASGQYKTSVQVSATDAVTGQALSNSPITIPVTINVTAPAMKLSTTNLSFSTTAGSNPANQTIQLSNVGGGTLKWSVGKPSQSWLSVSPSSGSCTAGNSSTLTFAINASGLAASTTAYQATVVIMPSSGAAVTVTVTLTVNAAGTPTATATGTASNGTPVATATPS